MQRRRQAPVERMVNVRSGHVQTVSHQVHPQTSEVLVEIIVPGQHAHVETEQNPVPRRQPVHQVFYVVIVIPRAHSLIRVQMFRRGVHSLVKLA